MKRLVALTAIALWAAVLAGQWQESSHDHPVHLPHALSAAFGTGSDMMTLDHAHIGKGSVPHVPDGFTAAVLPRTTAAAAALSWVAFVVGGAVMFGCAIVVRSQRGPPDRHGVLVAGRELLLRICIARR
ncbi:MULTISPECIES: hypothetical protein [unclassified Mycobacterium]|uniref:hypothetical protein n=1 Tax=unclassified Mycobacterium TaxID=2642494 RepID=UPI0009EEC85E|nr:MULTISPECIES: hypothetical protein [unclassified Mycobacterium]